MTDREKDRERPRAVGIPRAPGRVRRQVDEELRFHLEERVEELMQQGMTRSAAEAEAARRFGDVHRIGEETARVDRETLARRSLFDRVGAIKGDVRVAWRGFARRPLFACIVVITLALAIGGNGAIFSALNAVLLRPFVVPALDRLIVIQDRLAALGLDSAEVSPAEAADLAQERELFDAAAGWTTTSLNLEGDGDPERVRAASTIGSFFEVFRAKPLLGRLYDSTDAQEGRAPVAVLSYALWQQRFGGDAGIVGRNISMSGRTFEIRGVMPPDFRMPRTAQLWIPFAMTARVRSPEQRMSLYAVSVARLRDGISIEQVRARFPAVTAKWRERYPDSYGSKEGEGPQLIASPLVQQMAGALRPVLLVLVGAVGLVLLIACANVASLQLVRAAERGRELAVRAAMGAGRGAIARQLMVENALLGLAGGALGLALAAALTRGLRLAASTQFPALNDVTLDTRVVLFTLAVTVLSVLLFGLLPVLRASRVDVREALNDASRGSTGGLSRHRLLASSVVAQVALALVLLSGSVLTLRSLARLLALDPGFHSSGVMTMRVSLPGARYTGGAARSAFFDALVERAQSIPGVQAAGITSAPPLSGYGDSSPFTIIGQDTLSGGPVKHADMRVVGGDYFKAMGIPVLRGRALTAADGPSDLPTVVIDESLARQFFRGEDPIGRQISQGRPSLIVGVVGSVKHRDVSEPWKAVIYYSQHDNDWLPSMTLVVRSTLPPAVMTAQLRQAVKALDPSLPPYEVMPMTERLAQSLGTRKLAATVLGGFAAISILLVMLGVWGVIGYRMTQRTQEIGIRIALGARPVDIRRMVLRDALVLAGLGSIAGVLLFLAVSRALAALLYGVGARDPLTLLAVTLALAVVGLAASWIPARRAARIDPLLSMRAT